MKDEDLDAVAGGLGMSSFPLEHESTIVYYKCPHCGEENSETVLNQIHWSCAYCFQHYDNTAERREVTQKIDARNLSYQVPTGPQR